MAGNMPRGVEVAGLGPRLLGWLIDASVPAALGGLVWFLSARVIETSTTLLVLTLVVVLAQLGWALLLWWGYGGRGAGVGFRVVGLQLVGIDDGKPIGWWRYFLRQLVWTALMVTVVGGVLLLIFLVIQQRRQGWHDLAARSVAITATTPQRRSAPRTVTQPRRTPSTTVALPPHLVARAFDGSAGQTTFQQDPAEVARQAVSYGGQGPARQTSWRPPAAPGAAPEAGPRPTQRRSLTEESTHEQPALTLPSDSREWSPPSAAAPPPPSSPSPGSRPGQWKHPQDPSAAGQTRVHSRRLDPSAEVGTHLAPRPTSPPSRQAHEGWYLVMDDGRQVNLTGLVVIGRKPTQPLGVGPAELVPAGEGGQAVSKNHLQVGVDARGVWITDTGSTNGTAVVTAVGELEPCVPGMPVRCREGQVVSFGDRSLTIRRRPAVC